MLQNYFKIAWRNLFRNKGFSFTNLIGLAIGMTCTILILLWVQDELSFNKFQKNYKTLYQVMANRNFNGTVTTDGSVMFALPEAAEKNLPEVKNAVVTSYPDSRILTIGDQKLKKTGYFVSPHYFNMFSWEFLSGNPSSAIKDPDAIVLTESTAKALFGDQDPMNKILKFDNDYNAKVTGVVKDPPSNSTFKFDFIVPFNYSDEFIKKAQGDWVNCFSNVFIQTREPVNQEAFGKQLTNLLKQHDPESKGELFVHPMSKWRLYSDFRDGKNVGGMIEYVKLFTVIAFIILLIACVNFMNLSTARSERRAKEVGIRKTLGSDKNQLIFQFYLESLILSLISFLLAIGTVYLLLPSFNLLVDKQLSLDPGSPLFWLAALSIISLTGLLAGSYPALYLSSFSPARVLKGTFQPGKKALMPRKVLVVGQFTISILLISATLIIYKQIKHVKNRDIGYKTSNLIMVPSSPDTDKSFNVIKNELLKTGMFAGVTRTSAPITDIWNYSPGPEWKGMPPNANLIVAALGVDEDFSKTMNIRMLQGRDFSGADSTAMILNEAAVKVMNLKEPIGQQLRFNGKSFTVIGVTANVVMSSPYKPVDPMVMLLRNRGSAFISIRLQENIKPQTALDAMGSVFKRYNPSAPFEYRFVDQEFNKKFLTEELISKLTNLFAGLAIFICCLGLSGLAAFTIEKRYREIGIRKVLGASVSQVLILIAREFLKLVSFAFLIAVPLTWWGMNNWLQKYAYRIDINIWLFVIVGSFALLLTLVTVSLNTIRAALSNPVKSLRSE